jgi:hypothetical protein
MDFITFALYVISGFRRWIKITRSLARERGYPINDSAG